MDITSYLLGRKSSGGGGGGSDLDWSAVGFDNTPQSIMSIYNYSKQIYDDWDDTASLYDKFAEDKKLVIFPKVSIGSGQTTMERTFFNCTNLLEIGEIDTSGMYTFSVTFSGCTNLKYLPVFDLSAATYIKNFVANCPNLTDEALDNILQTCISAVNITNRTLAHIGISNATVYPQSRIQALPHYEDFIDAGWTIGY